jgi:hypothetical protein
MNKYVTKFITVLLLVAAVLTQSAAAFAQGGGNKPDGHRPPPGIGGTVASIDTSAGTLTVEVDQGPRKGTWTVTTTADTTYHVKDVDNATLANITVGDMVNVKGQAKDADKTITAKDIQVMPADKPNDKPAEGAGIGGKVASVDTTAGTLTLTVDRGPVTGTWTVNTTADTKYHVKDVTNATLADIKVDDLVGVQGQVNETDKTVTAKDIKVMPAKPANGSKVGGEITAINGTSLTLKARNGDVLTILTDENTQYRARGNKDFSFADLKVGDKVAVEGSAVEGQDNTILATVIGLKPVEHSDK